MTRRLLLAVPLLLATPLLLALPLRLPGAVPAGADPPGVLHGDAIASGLSGGLLAAHRASRPTASHSLWIRGLRIPPRAGRFDVRLQGLEGTEDEPSVAVYSVSGRARRLRSVRTFSLQAPLRTFRYVRYRRTGEIFLVSVELTRFGSLVVWRIDPRSLGAALLAQVRGGTDDRLADGLVFEHQMARYVDVPASWHLKGETVVVRRWRYDPARHAFRRGGWHVLRG